ncbi:hypothetical protein SBOR_1943 [Sclerotinia borealis F-4128]|uniref:Uncharacterized protein n=1 Tax=Sclerotinia borealis (strain F-4128) TaxID=1432307 RepID=W9CP69_SCLBF|nr:hypothetical protein SBOR_1943 [Sclerotinia borealis F-4128]
MPASPRTHKKNIQSNTSRPSSLAAPVFSIMPSSKKPVNLTISEIRPGQEYWFAPNSPLRSPKAAKKPAAPESENIPIKLDQSNNKKDNTGKR